MDEIQPLKDKCNVLLLTLIKHNEGVLERCIDRLTAALKQFPLIEAHVKDYADDSVRTLDFLTRKRYAAQSFLLDHARLLDPNDGHVAIHGSRHRENTQKIDKLEGLSKIYTPFERPFGLGRHTPVDDIYFEGIKSLKPYFVHAAEFTEHFLTAYSELVEHISDVINKSSTEPHKRITDLKAMTLLGEVPRHIEFGRSVVACSYDLKEELKIIGVHAPAPKL